MGSDSKTFTLTRATEYNYFLFVAKIAKIKGCATNYRRNPGAEVGEGGRPNLENQ